nr:unnamed protein product [Callosobruchus chinensis]
MQKFDESNVQGILAQGAKRKDDLAFCRAYILFQQWKKIKGKSYWESLDALMYTLFNRTPEELQTNETLKRVLLVEHNSILDAFAHIDNDNLIMVRKYFESIQPENIQNVNFLHSGFDEPDESIELGSSKTEEEQGLRDYYINYRKSMDLVPTPNSVELKEENDSDDDCQFVGVVMDAPEIIHEIYDDDIQEIAITIPSEHDDSESQKVDEQIRLSGDGPVIGDEIISRTDKDGNDHSHQRKASNNMQQSSAQDKINKGPSDLPPSDENVADLSKAVAETVVISLSDNEEESTVTGNPKSMDNSPAVVSQSKDTSTIHETCDLEETFCENQRTSSKEKTSDSETRDQIYTSTPSKHVTDTFFNGSEVSISSPSSSNLPNHTPNRSEDPYASPNHPDISSTTCTEGSEQCLETEQCTISENLTDICIENNTQSLLGDGDDVTIESPDLINDKQCTSVADDASDEKAGAYSNNLENSMFTKMPDKSDLRRMNGQKTWEDGKDTHELDNFMSGPVQNYVSGSVLPGEDFDDLFDDTACTSNADTQIAPSISSYEKRVDAFKVYFEETSSMGKHQTTILKKRDNLNESDKPRTSKVKRVTFDERSIMRKEIPKMSTLKRTDWKLKDSPYVSLEKLTEAQIDQRLKQMSEIARIARLEKEHRARSQNQNKQNTTLFKIDYDKTEVSLTQREVEQVRNIFLDNFQEDVVSKSVEGMVDDSFNKTCKNNLEERFSSYDCNTEIRHLNINCTDSSANFNYHSCQNTDNQGCGYLQQSEETYVTNLLGSSSCSFVNNEQFNVEYSRKLESPIFDENNTKPISTLEDVKSMSGIPTLEELSPSFSSFSNSPNDNLLSEYVSEICQSEHVIGQDMFNPDKCGSALQEANYIAVNNTEIPKEENVDLRNEPQNSFDVKTALPKLDEGGKVCLPLKKRKLSVANNDEEYYLGPDIVEEIIKQARLEEFTKEEVKEEISYPAKPMISIAEIQEELKQSPPPRMFKTPAEKKEMPPPPLLKQTEEVPSHQYDAKLEQPKIVTEQYNNHTYNNPTINYHMNNLPYTFFPYAGIQYFPQIILPMSNTNFDVEKQFDISMMTQPQANPPQDAQSKPKEKKKGRGRKKC